MKDREKASEWAKKIIQEPSAIILDTETTGLDPRAEACSISILSLKKGETIMDTLVKPSIPIPEEATKIHGITNEEVKNAPTFLDIYGDFQAAVKDKTVVIYNAKFDRRIIRYCSHLYQLPSPRCKIFFCAMQQYSKWVGEWNNFSGSYTWQPLPGGDHTSLGDCKATREIILKMSGSSEAV